HNIKHNRVLHQRNVVVHVNTEERPHAPPEHRVEVEPLDASFYRVKINYGFMEDPDVPAALARAGEQGLEMDPAMATDFLSRNTLIATERPGMALWRERLFVLLSRNAGRPGQFFNLPPNRVVELGMQVEL